MADLVTPRCWARSSMLVPSKPRSLKSTTLRSRTVARSSPGRPRRRGSVMLAPSSLADEVLHPSMTSQARSCLQFDAAAAELGHDVVAAADRYVVDAGSPPSGPDLRLGLQDV